MRIGRPENGTQAREKKAMKPLKITQSQANRVEANFDGEAHLQRLVSADQGSEIEVLAVFFSPGARNRPHTHEHDQILHILSGTAVVAMETARALLSPGELIRIPAQTWHWHGATSEGPMCHLAIQRPGFINWEVEERDWATPKCMVYFTSWLQRQIGSHLKPRHFFWSLGAGFRLEAASVEGI
jgi:quercetin dioxygenase-like cupin family protein